jgi:hypothetical protein
MKLKEITAKSGLLYRNIGDSVANQLLSGKSVPNNSKFTSFVKDVKHLKAEFGNRTICCKIVDLPKTVKLIEIQYDFEWFTRSTLNKELLQRVTGRTEEDFLEEFDHDIDLIDDEISTMYSEEEEIVLVNLLSFEPEIFKVVK